MISKMPETSAEALIDSLRQANRASETQLEWLVIAHDDERLVDSLTTSLSAVASHLLELPQSAWDFTEGGLAAAIEWAVDQGAIKHLVLVGHSQAEDEGEQPSSDEILSRNDGYRRLHAGVTRTSVQTKKSQDLLEKQLESLTAMKSVRKKVLDGELSVYGLFFMAQSTTFLAYDPDQQDFLALIP
jgi:hypothetical protein